MNLLKTLDKNETMHCEQSKTSIALLLNIFYIYIYMYKNSCSRSGKHKNSTKSNTKAANTVNGFSVQNDEHLYSAVSTYCTVAGD